MTTDDGYVVKHGEKYRRLITCALRWLKETEPSWNLKRPIGVDGYISALVREAKKGEK